VPRLHGGAFFVRTGGFSFYLQVFTIRKLFRTRNKSLYPIDFVWPDLPGNREIVLNRRVCAFAEG
jgi:hypothetical protein